MNKPQIKICCISSIEEAKIAVNLGASAIGLVGQMPSGPGIISNELIKKIANSVPKDIDTLTLSYTLYDITERVNGSLAKN